MCVCVYAKLFMCDCVCCVVYIGSSESEVKRIRSYLKEQWKLLPRDL